MDTLPLHLFNDSAEAFLALLEEHGIKYQARPIRLGVPMAAGETVEIIKAIGSIVFFPSLATVIVAFIRARRGRKVIVTTEGNTVVHLEGMSPKEIEQILSQAQNITAIDPNKKEGK